MRATALVFALPVATLAITCSELTRVPYGSAERHLSAFGEIARGAVDQLVFLALLTVLSAITLALVDARDRSPHVRIGTRVLVGLVLSFAAHASLTAPLVWHPIVLACSCVIGLGFGGLLSLRTETRGAAARDHVLTVVVIVGSLVLARAHYQVLIGQYPSAHAWMMRVAFIGLTLGIGRTFHMIDRSRAVPVLAVVAMALALSIAFVAPSPAEASPAVLAYTELGRGAGVAQALRQHRASLHPTEIRTSQESLPDFDARARFDHHSGLPPLETSIEDLDVLFVLIEATRFDRTSLASSEPSPENDRTPNLRRLAATSLSFDRAYAPSNGTFASVSSIVAMTPASFAELDVRPRFWRGRLRDEQVTAAETMQAAGRQTFYVGHDHKGTFSHTIRGVTQGFDEVTLIAQEPGVAADADADARIADAARDAWLARTSRGTTFGMVFFVSPHDDYQVHDEGAASATELDRYDQELRFADEQLGRLLEVVDLHRTVVVVAGDHGEAFGEHGVHHHLTSLHDEQIHVPLVVHVPGMRPSRHDAPTSVLYVLPWLLLRGRQEERTRAEHVLTNDIGPMMRETEGAVLSEMIGPDRQEAVLIYSDLTILYDVLSQVTQVYVREDDPEQQDDVAESRPDLFARAVDLSLDYRRARFGGQRFRFMR